MWPFDLRSDRQPAGHTDDPWGGHPRPGVGEVASEGQGVASGGGEGSSAKQEPGSGRQAEAADPHIREGIKQTMISIIKTRGERCPPSVHEFSSRRAFLRNKKGGKLSESKAESWFFFFNLFFSQIKFFKMLLQCYCLGVVNYRCALRKYSPPVNFWMFHNLKLKPTLTGSWHEIRQLWCFQ